MRKKWFLLRSALQGGTTSFPKGIRGCMKKDFTIYLSFTGRIDMCIVRKWSINTGVKSSPSLLLNLKLQAVTTPSLTQ